MPVPYASITIDERKRRVAKTRTVPGYASLPVYSPIPMNVPPEPDAGHGPSAPPTPHGRTHTTDMDTELAIVRQVLHTELRSLDSLLAYLLPSSVLADSHLLYSRIILAIGLPQHDTWRALHQRCQLAIALELLGRALQIHHRMLVETAERDIDIADIAGPVILIGDFYFARAAQLVTQLGNPLLLDAFAQVLKKVSEQHLGHKLRCRTQVFNAAAILSTYGIHCGAHLQVNLDTAGIVRAWQQLSHAFPATAEPTADALHPLLAATPPHQHDRWYACGAQYRTLLDRVRTMSSPFDLVI